MCVKFEGNWTIIGVKQSVSTSLHSESRGRIICMEERHGITNKRHKTGLMWRVKYAHSGYLEVSMGHAGEENLRRKGMKIIEVADDGEERGGWLQGPVRRQRSG